MRKAILTVLIMASMAMVGLAYYGDQPIGWDGDCLVYVTINSAYYERCPNGQVFYLGVYFDDLAFQHNFYPFDKRYRRLYHRHSYRKES